MPLRPDGYRPMNLLAERPRVTERLDRPGWIDVEVPTETGSVCVVTMAWDHDQDSYTFEVSGNFLDQSPEGITATIQVAMLTLHGYRNFERYGPRS